MHFCTALDVSLTFSYISSIFKNGTTREKQIFRQIMSDRHRLPQLCMVHTPA